MAWFLYGLTVSNGQSLFRVWDKYGLEVELQASCQPATDGQGYNELPTGNQGLNGLPRTQWFVKDSQVEWKDSSISNV